MWKYYRHTTFQIKVAKTTNEKKNEWIWYRKPNKKKSPLAHSSAHSSPNISKAPNLLLTSSKSRNKKQKQNKSVSYSYFVIFVCIHECRFLGSRLLLLLQLIPMATISISLYFCYYVLSFFFIASYVLGENIRKLLAKCVFKKKVAFYVLYST